MRFTQRGAMLAAMAITGLALAAPATAAAVPESSAQGTAQAAKGCITVTATISVGNAPGAVAADPKTNTVYVVNDVNDTVSVISGRTNTVTSTIPVGKIQQGIAADTKNKAIYVANSDSGTVSVLAACPK
jgi:YVTN family beta-propeller protein